MKIVAMILLAQLMLAAVQVPPGEPRQLPEGTIVHRDLPYVTGGHERQKLDLYVPKDGKQLPLVVVIHGGGFMAGSKDHTNPVPFLEAGYAVASINYRLSQHAIWPAQIVDCKSAVRWLRKNAAQYNLDRDRFAAYGPSAGGHLSAMLGVTATIRQFDMGEHLQVSSAVQAVADFFGPTDFLQMDDHRLPDGLIHNGAGSPESRLIGGPIQENKEKVARANPITYVARDAPPFLIVHGDADPLVPHHQSQLLEIALKRVGVPVTFYTVKGGGHGNFTDPKVPQLLQEFLAKHLKKQGT